MTGPSRRGSRSPHDIPDLIIEPDVAITPCTPSRSNIASRMELRIKCTDSRVEVRTPYESQGLPLS